MSDPRKGKWIGGWRNVHQGVGVMVIITQIYEEFNLPSALPRKELQYNIRPPPSLTFFPKSLTVLTQLKIFNLTSRYKEGPPSFSAFLACL